MDEREREGGQVFLSEVYGADELVSRQIWAVCNLEDLPLRLN